MKLLIIRFSSFGDIVQAIAVPRAFLNAYPDSTVDWLTRAEFADLLLAQPSISKVLPFSRALGFRGLIRLAMSLSGARYTHVYDAHSNLRSGVLVTILRFMNVFGFLRSMPWIRFATRPKNRLRRFLFFKFRLEVLPRPFRAADSYHRPLVKWGLPADVPTGSQFYVSLAPLNSDIARLRETSSDVIAIAPSAAWEMKRWPIEHWKTLIEILPSAGFLILGGSEDTFLADLVSAAPLRVVNFAGRLSMVESSQVIAAADLVISNDTGPLQVADQLERPTIALIGPTAFGYPSHATSMYLERPLWCQPCSKDGRGACVNSLYKRCLVELTPESVAEKAREILNQKRSSRVGLA